MDGGPMNTPGADGGPLPGGVAGGLRDRFDAVVMLTWSDWHAEPRSNRYHYASRFARHLPVYFVQEEEIDGECRLEPTGTAGVTVVHCPAGTALGGCDVHRTQALARALRARGVLRPLVWVYNTRFAHFLRCAYAPLKVYHATEDYVSGDYFRAGHGVSPRLLDEMRGTLDACDVLLSVSDGVRDAYHRVIGFAGTSLVATNGCDFEFLAARPGEAAAAGTRPIALYQGGINNRLDFELLRDTVRALPHWTFQFCGRVLFRPGERHLARLWRELRAAPNVAYLGELEPDALRAAMRAATVGLIPFVRNPSIVDRSFPLKAFEYVACGLPVAGVPIRALRQWPELFASADDAAGLARAIEAAGATRFDPGLLKRRAHEAYAQGYDGKFATVCDRLAAVAAPRPRPWRRRVLVLFDDRSTHVKTIEHHLTSFLKYSANEIAFAPCTGGRECVYDLTRFDAVVVHYSVRLCAKGHLSASYEQALEAYPGLKILFAQDEYDHTNQLKTAMRELGIQVLYTCVPPGSVRQVYSEPFFDRVHFVHTLTGFVPPEFELDTRPITPPADRPVLIGYRGRDIGWWYGDLAREKLLIGVRMKEICDARGLPTDIAWAEADRVYGPAWLDFLARCRATLATESGSNVFDFDGTLRRRVEEERRLNPAATYEEVHARHLRRHEGAVVMNQISPKLFEAVALRTALILFEGSYSGVVQAGVHYLPLRKDFSNVDDVLRQVQDDAVVRTMTERAYADIVASGRYSYRAFVRDFDAELDRLLGAVPPRHTGEQPAPAATLPLGPHAALPLPPTIPLSFKVGRAYRGAKRLGKRVLRPARDVVRAVLAQIRTKAG
jgi:glycosyltransferase involved in cell wall biosynthesis